MSRRIGELIGHAVSPVVESLDVNAIVNEINIDEVLSHVDWNAILERVDVNHHLDRIDMDRLLENVDIDRLIERSNLEEIVSRASSGVFSEFIDMMRTRIAWIDQWGQRICHCRCFSRQPLLPPRPGRPQDNKKVWPKSSGLRARKFGVSVQFRTCGGLCRGASAFVDGFFLAFTFAAYSWIVSRLVMVLTDDPLWSLRAEWEWITTVLFALYGLIYNFCMLACFSRTIGMWLLGLLLVSRDGHRLRPYQAFLFAFFIPLNLALFGWVLVSYGCCKGHARVSDLDWIKLTARLLPFVYCDRHFYVETEKDGMSSYHVLLLCMPGMQKTSRNSTRI